MRFQTTNTSILELFLDDFHDDSWGVKDYSCCMKLIGIKSGKNNKSGQYFGGCTGTGTGVYRYRPPEANLYRYRPTECNLYRYRSRVYRYR